MANLGTFRIKTDNEWEDFETLTELTLVNDTVYLMQTGNICRFCAKASEPDDDEQGFTIDFNLPFEYKHNVANTLYVKTPDRMYADVNIAD